MTRRHWNTNQHLTWRQLRERMVGRPDEPAPPEPERAAPAAPPPPRPPEGYAELHAHSHFSFLDGASSPAELVAEAVRLGLSGLAITDHDGLYGVVRFAEAARGTGLSTVYGAELGLEMSAERADVPDPPARHLLILARDPEGYARLSAVIGQAQLDGASKGRPVYRLEHVADVLRDHAVVLTGCRKGSVRHALAAEGPAAADRQLRRLVDLFGPEGVAVELTDRRRADADANRALYSLAERLRLPTVATNNVHYARPSQHRLAQVVAAIRASKPLEEMDGWLDPSPTAHLRSPQEMRQRFAAFPGAVDHSLRLARELAFDLELIAPELPSFSTADEDEETVLRRMAAQGAAERYGSPIQRHVHEKLEHELSVIVDNGFPGYFLIVHDIVRFCREQRILVQGRGSAANSVVCYCLGITRADPIGFDLLFERFLSPERDGPPDIDLDIEARRREEVIQYVYEKYERTQAAQVANVITYRRRSAVRDVAVALGHSPAEVDGWVADSPRRGGPALEELPSEVAEYAEQLLDAPRHLGIHSGGMVLCDRAVTSVVPVEHARMDKRTVVQWDKDDCAAAGLVKFDLLGLGMLTALHQSSDLADAHYDPGVDLDSLEPEDPIVYRMIHKGDSIGVFQVESRAQLQLAPRLRPSNLRQLAIQIALVRPGPIQGGAVHPYVRRLRGEEDVRYPHPAMESALKHTLGVPLFQEQMMALAMKCASFSPVEADELRQAMSSKRSVERMSRLRDRFYVGAARNGITGELADDLWSRMEAFSGYGFPESHALSFAYLAYASAYLKRYFPAAFLAGLIRAQPMGFYGVNSLIADARHHGVEISGVDVNASAATTGLVGRGRPADADAPPETWGHRGPSVRLGLDRVRGMDADTAERIARGAPYVSVSDVARRAEVSGRVLENLATAGAFEGLGQSRRGALWRAGAAAGSAGTIAGTVSDGAPPLPGMSDAELTAADVWATGASATRHPIQHIRHQLDAHGAVPIAALAGARNGERVLIGGLVTHRQAPETAHGVLFLNLEDETGHTNIICPPGLRLAHPRPAHRAGALMVRGKLENKDGSIAVTADKLVPVRPPGQTATRNFR